MTSQQRTSAISLRGLGLAAAAMLMQFSAVAQTTPGAPGVSADTTVNVIGLVTDATSRAPIVAAEIALGANGRTTSSDAQGRFALAGVAPGPYRVTVRRLGYLNLVTDVTVTNPMGGLQLQMRPDPVMLSALAVIAEARSKAPVRGRVLDAFTRQPIPYASVNVSRDGITQVGRAGASDKDGAFQLPDVQLGAYVLRVDRLGYAPRYLSFAHTLPGAPLEVTLNPDGVLLEGIVATVGRIDERRNAWGYSTQQYGEDRLRESRSLGMCGFLATLAEFPLDEIQCRSIRDIQREYRVFLDERSVPLSELDSYAPAELQSVEYFLCPAPPSPSTISVRNPPTREIHAYTYAYMEKVGRRAQALLPPCLRALEEMDR